MTTSTLKLIIRKTRQDLMRGKQNLLISFTIILFCMLSIGIGFTKYTETNAQVQEYRRQVRDQWEHRPAKHPHRMAHYGYLVFRMAHPLSIFDNGLDDYLGNVIFLEAHKQNSANLSEAGSSGILVRFGTFSSAFILQCIVPLILLFLGFGLIAREREDATLKILSTQGASGTTIVKGKILGLWQFSLLFLLPVLPVVLVAALMSGMSGIADVSVRLLTILPGYLIYYFFISTVTVLVSAVSRSSSLALVGLIGSWLLLVIFLPKGIQFAAQNLYPVPSRIAFETALEKDILKAGDSHNPDDPHFKKIKDSLLARYKVNATSELPFNYSGFVMKEGEKISSQIYIRHQKALEETFRKQQRFSEISAFFDPMMAVKNLSMAASGTDYFSYTGFQKQAEEYRYRMAQKLNELQIEKISNIKPEKGGRPAIVDAGNWKKFPDFKYQQASFRESITEQWISVAALVFWLAVCVGMIETIGRNLKLI
ncbi:ABC transporter permease [Chryseobacterium sp. sg2396]|uniref:ABC transporter permease n=1 Tax=Chryseobacterium sp. sg2396 TaxID=3276280 RepID=UPI00366DD9EA